MEVLVATPERNAPLTSTRKRKSEETDKTNAWDAIADALKPKDSPARELLYVEQAKQVGLENLVLQNNVKNSEQLLAFEAASAMYKHAKDMKDNDALQHIIDHVRERAAALMPASI
jgi:hypothetical protein